MNIHDLARHLNISIGTVSRALNGRSDVSDETRRRVIEAAKTLNYAPNQSGRSLRQGTTNVVAFMMETSPQTETYASDFFTAIFDGVQTVLSTRRLDLVILLCSSGESPFEFLRRFLARGFVDGVFLSSTLRHDRRIELLSDHRIPFVALGRSLSDIPYSWIDLDFEGIMESSIERFVRGGHRRIAVASASGDINFGYVFVEAYRRELEKHGLPFDPQLVLYGDQNESGGYRVGEILLAMPVRPTAVVMVHELMAVGLYRKLSDAGLCPGDDMAIIGFRDSPRCQHLSPPLTRFRPTLRELGIRLADILLAEMGQINGEPPFTLPVRELWPMKLIEGESDPPIRAANGEV